MLIVAFWISFAASSVIYAIMVLWSLPRISAEANGLVPFDMRPTGYSLEEARSFLAALSKDGRIFYLTTQHRLDAVYPPLMAITLALGLWLLSPSFTLWVRLPLILVPILAMVSDLTENQLVSDMLNSPVDSLDSELIMTANTATLIKSALTTIAGSLLLALTAAWAWKRWRRP